jgi:tyrosyl-tRNA synthetase
VERALPEEVEEAVLPASDPVHLPALLREHFGMSSSEARRLLAGGGVRLDGEQLSGEDLDLPAERLVGAVLQVGKRRHKRFRAPAPA